MNTIKVKASELKVGDKFASGATITAADAYVMEGYGLPYVRTMDTGMKTCMGAHFPADCMVIIQERSV